MNSITISSAKVANRIRQSKGLKPLSLSFFEESKHPRGEHGRFAAKESLGNQGGLNHSNYGGGPSSSARSNLHYFLKELGSAAHEVLTHPLIVALIGGAALYYLAPIIASAAASATSQWATAKVNSSLMNYGIRTAIGALG